MEAIEWMLTVPHLVPSGVMSRPLVLVALVGLLLLAAMSFAPVPRTSVIYWTSGTPGAANMDQLNICVSHGGFWSIDQVLVWDGTGTEPSGDDWDPDASNITEYPQTSNSPPPGGEWRNESGSLGSPELWFGDDIPSAGKVRVCIKYNFDPAPVIEAKNPEWENHS